MRTSARGAHARVLALLTTLGLAAALTVTDLVVHPSSAHAAVTVSDQTQFATAIANHEDEILLDVPADETWTFMSALIITSNMKIAAAPGAATVTLASSSDVFILATGVAFSVSGVNLGSSAASAINAPTGAAIELTDVVLAGTATGVLQSGGTLTATRVTANNHNGSGLSLINMTSVTLDRVTTSGNRIGMILSTSGGTIIVRNSFIEQNGSLLAGAYGGLVLSATNDASVTIENTSITGNMAFNAAGLRIDRLHRSSLTIRDSTVAGNRAFGWGGGIATVDPANEYSINNQAELLIERTVVEGNQANDTGGGIALTAVQGGSTVTITQSTIRGNQAFFGAGVTASYLHNGPNLAFTLDSSTVSGNIAGGSVGGVMLECDDDPGAGGALIVNSTFSGNTADNQGAALGGGCDADDGMTVQLLNSTITANGGNASSTVAFIHVGAQIRNSVLGGNGNATDLDLTTATSTTIDYSLVERTDATSLPVLALGTGNIPGAAPQLGALASNGGPTQTHLPAAGGNLVDTGDPAFVAPPGTDQRGEARVVGVLDLGAVELAAATPPVAGPGPAILPPTGSDPLLPTGLGLGALVLGSLLTLIARMRRHAHPR